MTELKPGTVRMAMKSAIIGSQPKVAALSRVFGQ